MEKDLQKIFVERLKQIDKIVKKYGDSDSLREYIDNEYIDEEGIAVIKINLYEGLDLYNKLSIEKQLDLNPDIYEYIDNKAKIIPPHIPLKLKFYGRHLEDHEQELIKKLIKEHYSIELFDQHKNRRITRIKAKRLLAVGATLFLFVLFLKNLRVNSIITDLLSIIATFSIWEIAHLILIEKKDIKFDTLHIAKMLLHEIEFE